MSLDAQIAKLRKELNELQERKRKNKRPKPEKSLRPKGRPRITANKILQAKTLAKDFPITDVANRLQVSISTLYRYGIKRYLIDRERMNDNLSVKP